MTEEDQRPERTVRHSTYLTLGSLKGEKIVSIGCVEVKGPSVKVGRGVGKEVPK